MDAYKRYYPHQPAQKDMRLGEELTWSASGAGWRFARGMSVLVLGCVAGALAVPPLTAKSLPRWMGTMLIPNGGIGVATIALALWFWLDTGTSGFAGEFHTVSQAVSVGPFLALAGSVVLLAGVVMEGAQRASRG
jgi:hypothetical protein